MFTCSEMKSGDMRKLVASSLPRDALVHSAVLRLHVVCLSVRLSVRLSVCDVGGSGSHRLEILETNCTDT